MSEKETRVEHNRNVSAVFQRLDGFHRKGLLTQQHYEHYYQLLNKYKSDYYIQQVTKHLDQIANKELSDRNKALSSEVQQEVVNGPSSHSARKPLPYPSKKGMFSMKSRSNWGDRPPASLSIEFSDDDTKHSEKENSLTSDHRENCQVILEPEDLWRGEIYFDEQQLQDLFVEMCFFARLGYAQPPCCLKCTYKETKNQEKLKGRSSTAPPGDPMCQRWVVWRKNADTLLHPNKLDGNILIMHCNVAQKLLNGKVVEGRRWNAEQRRVATLSVA